MRSALRLGFSSLISQNLAAQLAKGHAISEGYWVDTFSAVNFLKKPHTVWKKSFVIKFREWCRAFSGQPKTVRSVPAHRGHEYLHQGSSMYRDILVASASWCPTLWAEVCLVNTIPLLCHQHLLWIKFGILYISGSAVRGPVPYHDDAHDTSSIRWRSSKKVVKPLCRNQIAISSARLSVRTLKASVPVLPSGAAPRLNFGNGRGKWYYK